MEPKAWCPWERRTPTLSPKPSKGHQTLLPRRRGCLLWQDPAVCPSAWGTPSQGGKGLGNDLCRAKLPALSLLVLYLIPRMSCAGLHHCPAGDIITVPSAHLLVSAVALLQEPLQTPTPQMSKSLYNPVQVLCLCTPPGAFSQLSTSLRTPHAM